MSCTDESECTSLLPARKAICCVCFNKHCVVEEVSDVPQLSCHGTELIFLGSFTKKVLEHQSTIKTSVTVISVDGLSTDAKDRKSLEAKVPEK